MSPSTPVVDSTPVTPDPLPVSDHIDATADQSTGAGEFSHRGLPYN